jgi:hypothetical protein
MKNAIIKTALSTMIALMITGANAYSQRRAFSAPQNMGATLNTPSDETGPIISPNGLSLYFSSNRANGQGSTDIWVAHRATLASAWGAPQNLGATVNSSANDNITGFSLDGRSMLLNSARVAGGQGGADLWISTRTDANDDFGWTAPVNLGPVVNSSFLENSGNFFEDPLTGAMTLIFSSDRAGGIPGVKFDFFQSTRNTDGTFNPPTLISELNGEGSHFGSAIRRDGLEILIASSRPAGLNNPRWDIFVTTRATTAEPWGTPVLAAGINDFAEDDRLPKFSPDGAILYFSSSRAGGAGGFDLYSATRCSVYAADAPCSVNRAPADFDGDGRADFSVYRPSEGNWYIMQSGTNTFRVHSFGLSGDKIAPGDYDGDGRTDFAVFRPSTGTWWIRRSSDNSVSTTAWGLATDKPVPADYDGDGRADIAVYRDGTWYIIQSSTGGFIYHQFGLSSDIPVAGANVQ